MIRLVANGIELDLFNDEPIIINNNITDLFDISVLPSEFTKDIALPGSRTNDAFFEHVYDISITSPNNFATNKKIDCYIEGSVYLIQGYLMLNSVEIYNNKNISGYNITVYGMLSNFKTLVSNKYLTDLTSLDVYNTEMSIENLQDSWDLNLHSGNIVFPLAEYGQKMTFARDVYKYGIEEQNGALGLIDFKPAIRVKPVFDAIFNENGYTYEGDFMDKPFFNNMYLFLNYEKRYPIVSGFTGLETYGTIKISPQGALNTSMVASTSLLIPWENIESNPSNLYSASGYTIDYRTTVRGTIAIKIGITNTGAGNGVPQFYLDFKPTSGASGTTELTQINNYFKQIQTEDISQGNTTATKVHLVEQNYSVPDLAPNTYKIYLRYTTLSGTNFSVKLDPVDETVESYLTVNKLNNIIDHSTIEISKNFPKDIKQIDFIKGIQKMFNLIIYQDKIKKNNFIIKTFNEWYNIGNVVDFNEFIDILKQIKITPANNLAVSKLEFKHKYNSNDYISKQFNDLNGREYGKELYEDTTNFYSSGTFSVETTFNSSPTQLIASTSSGEGNNIAYEVKITDTWVKDINAPLCPDHTASQSKILMQLYNPTTHTLSANYGDPFDIVFKFIKNGVNTFVNFHFAYGSSSVYYLYWDGWWDSNCNSITTTPSCVYNKPSYITIKADSSFTTC